MVTVIVAVIGLVVGGVLGYAFRGKEHAALQDAGNAVKGVAQDVTKKL